VGQVFHLRVARTDRVTFIDTYSRYRELDTLRAADVQMYTVFRIFTAN